MCQQILAETQKPRKCTACDRLTPVQETKTQMSKLGYPAKLHPVTQNVGKTKHEKRGGYCDKRHPVGNSLKGYGRTNTSSERAFHEKSCQLLFKSQQIEMSYQEMNELQHHARKVSVYGRGARSGGGGGQGQHLELDIWHRPQASPLTSPSTVSDFFGAKFGEV